MRDRIIVCFAVVFLLNGCATYQSRQTENLALHRLELLDKYCVNTPAEQRMVVLQPQMLKQIPPELGNKQSYQDVIGFSDTYGQEIIAYTVPRADKPNSTESCAIMSGKEDPTPVIGKWLLTKYPNASHKVHQTKAASPFNGKTRLFYFVKPIQGDAVTVYEVTRLGDGGYVSVKPMKLEDYEKIMNKAGT